MKNFLRLSLLFVLFWSVSCQKDDDSPQDPEPLANDLTTGSAAAEILSGDTYKSLTLEIQYSEGFAPPQGAVDDFVEFLEKYCDKPEGIEVIATEISHPAEATYTVEELRAIEDKYRTKFNTDNSISIYVLIAGGNYERDSDTTTVLGLAYRNTSFAVFQKPIRKNTGGLGRPSERLVTSMIYQHEMGHLMGLVNLGTPMTEDHEDTDHQKHCDNQDCLMYWALNNAAAMGNLLGTSSAPDLDAPCRADLKANGGK